MFLPVMSLPTQIVRADLEVLNLEPSSMSLKPTNDLVLFGTSIPTAFLLGIGASMRTLVAAKAMAKSRDRLLIFATLIPGAGRSSYLVTVGPQVMFITLASILKLLSVSSRIMAFVWH